MNLIHTHTTLDSFLDCHIPKRIMPAEYGGSAGGITNIIDVVYKEMQANEAFYIEEETTKRVNEQLRPGKPKTESGSIFSLFSNGKQKQWVHQKYTAVEYICILLSKLSDSTLLLKLWFQKHSKRLFCNALSCDFHFAYRLCRMY